MRGRLPDPLVETALDGLAPPLRGKVRDLYDLGETLLLVATDRISAYDQVLSPGIPGKGKVLAQLSIFWFEHLAPLVGHHLLATDPRDFPAAVAAHRHLLAGRAVLVRKARVVPFECVARGYLAGSGYRDYRRTGKVCGVSLPADLERASHLPEPIFTPATKAREGHDENVPLARLAGELGEELSERLRSLTLAVYEQGAAHAASRDLLLADTKLEFGLAEGDGEEELILVDEALTPDSSRYWDAERWQPGEEPPSFDKQFVRNWLDESGWDHESPPPELPAEVVEGTLERYLEAFRRLTGREADL